MGKSEIIVGGIEGGTTSSNIVLLNEKGQILVTVHGLHTNHYSIGIAEWRKRIADLVNKAKNEIGLSSDVPLDGLGMSLSGCENESTNQELLEGLKQNYPNLSRHYVIGSDTEGSIATVSNKGGVVCIAGTGSNTLLINPDGQKVQCGGWGHLLSDEGSGYEIALKAIRYCFDDLDNRILAPHSIVQIWKIIKEHFKIETQSEILDHFYRDFDKSNIAALCKKIADLADMGDKLSRTIFEECGINLARNILAVLPKASLDLTTKEGGLHVLCVGSVWLSFHLLKPGFVRHLKNHSNINNLSLIRLLVPASLGAAYLFADKFELSLARNYGANYTILYKYDQNQAFT